MSIVLQAEVLQQLLGAQHRPRLHSSDRRPDRQWPRRRLGVQVGQHLYLLWRGNVLAVFEAFQLDSEHGSSQSYLYQANRLPYRLLYGDQARFFDDEVRKTLKHHKPGMVGMAGAGKDMNASQFYFTLGSDLDSLDGKHTVFGEVSSSGLWTHLL